MLTSALMGLSRRYMLKEFPAFRERLVYMGPTPILTFMRNRGRSRQPWPVESIDAPLFEANHVRQLGRPRAEFHFLVPCAADEVHHHGFERSRQQSL